MDIIDIEFLLIMFTILLLIALYAVWEYNNLVSFRTRIDNAWNQFYELIVSRRMILLQFIESEHTTITDEQKVQLTTLIEQSKTAKTVADTLASEKKLTESLATLFDTPEFFADSANGNALRTLHNVDQRVSLAQMLYNDIVIIYLNKLESFPTNIIASIYGFKAESLSE